MSKTLTKEERIKANKELIALIKNEVLEGGLDIEGALDDWANTTNLERLVLRLCQIENGNFDYIMDNMENISQELKRLNDNLKVFMELVKEHSHLPDGKAVTTIK